MVACVKIKNYAKIEVYLENVVICKNEMGDIMVLTIMLLLIVFGMVLQYASTTILKKTVNKNTHKLLIGALVFDAVVIVAFILTTHFESPLIIRKILKYFTFLSIGTFYLIYMRALNARRSKRTIASFLILTLTSFVFVIFGDYIGKQIVEILSFSVLSFWVIVLINNRKYNSKHITTLVYLLSATELLRFSIESISTYQMLFSNEFYLWLTPVSFIVRSLTLLFIIEINSHNSINKNLAKTLDYQSATSLLNLVFNEHPNAVVLTDVNEKIIYINQRALEITGYLEQEVIGKTPKLFSSGKTKGEVYIDMRKALSENRSWTGEFINKKKNGETFTELAKIVVLCDVNNTPSFYLGIKTDITKEREYLNKLEYYSIHDGLTHLFRRDHFVDLMKKAILKDGVSNKHFFLMDIDGFKQINDIHGHRVGDEALKYFSEILKKHFNDKSILCRFGGDEFSGLIYNSTAEEVRNEMQSLFKKLDENPFKYKNIKINLKASVGITKIEEPYIFNKIYEKADKNLYKSKSQKGI